jgi:hypothetical protein
MLPGTREPQAISRGVLHVVVGLGQEGEVALERELAAPPMLDERYAEEVLPVRGGGGLKPVEEGVHEAISCR